MGDAQLLLRRTFQAYFSAKSGNHNGNTTENSSQFVHGTCVDTYLLPSVDCF